MGILRVHWSSHCIYTMVYDAPCNRNLQLYCKWKRQKKCCNKFNNFVWILWQNTSFVIKAQSIKISHTRKDKNYSRWPFLNPSIEKKTPNHFFLQSKFVSFFVVKKIDCIRTAGHWDILSFNHLNFFASQLTTRKYGWNYNWNSIWSTQMDDSQYIHKLYFNFSICFDFIHWFQDPNIRKCIRNLRWSKK